MADFAALQGQPHAVFYIVMFTLTKSYCEKVARKNKWHIYVRENTVVRILCLQSVKIILLFYTVFPC